MSAPADYRPLVTIAIPAYNCAAFVRPTLDSIVAQTYENIEVLVVDDGSSDDTCAVIERHGLPNLRLVGNDRNRGCMYTIARCAELARGEILTFLCHDDILSPVAIERIVAAFRDPRIGATTRPYYWFEGEDVSRPNRVIRPLALGQDVVITGREGYPTIRRLVETLGQISAMAFRREWLEVPFSEDVFTVHGQAFLGILRKHPVVYIGDYILAVRTETSQSRSLSSVYGKSPLATWDEMFARVFPEPEYAMLRRHCRRAMATENDVGLIQVKCTGGQRALLREIWVSVSLWPMNLLRPKFIACALGTLVIPRGPLRSLVDWAKNRIGARMIEGVALAGDLEG